jgi:hypothetical protein
MKQNDEKITKNLKKLLTGPGLKDGQNWIEAWEILKQSFAEKMNRDRTILNERWIESKLNQQFWIRVEVNRKLNDYEVEWFLIEVEPNRSFPEMKLGFNNSESMLNERIWGEWRQFKESEVWIWSLGWTRLNERRTKTNLRLNLNKRRTELQLWVWIDAIWERCDFWEKLI